MLEQPQLWFPSRPTFETAADIRTAPGGVPVGSARWDAPATFFQAAILSVHEADDAPLLFRAWRAWTFRRRFVVVDAEDRCVGYVQSEALFSSAGHPLIHRRRDGPTMRYRFLDGSGLATETQDGLSCRLVFGTGPGTDNPFQRMLVLAAALLG